MRLFILLAFVLAVDIYAFQAFRVMAQGWAPTWRNLFFGLYWLGTAVAVGTTIAAFFSDYHQWNKALFTVLRALLFILYFSKFVIALVVFLDDIRRLFTAGYEWYAGNGDFSPSRSQFMSRIAILMGGLPFLTLTYGILRNPYRYKIYRQEIELEDLPEALEGLKIVQISDIHSGSFFLKEPVTTSVDLINKESADLVFFTGDMVNSMASEMLPYKDIFKNIQSRYGVYSVRGNHDYGDYARWITAEERTANTRQFESIQAEMGWDLLKNENRILEIRGEKVAVIGIENTSALPQFSKYGDLTKAYRGSENAGVKLLLSHDPSFWDATVSKNYPDIDITFSGHTHGFQFGIEIPGFLKWSPSQYMYKQWAGLYQSGKQYLYVNRGLGFLGYPGRVGILPEITVVTLKKKFV